MADPTTVNRVEPTLGPTPAAASTASVEELRAAVQSAPPSPVEAPPSARADRPGSGQLSRIEDKADRIDEKYARTETLMQRVQDKVEAVTGQISEAALQSDLVIMRDRVEEAVRGLGRLPGLISLVFTAIVTALLAAALTVAAIKYFPGTPM